MPLVTLARFLVPGVLSAAKLFDIIVPCKVLNPAHNLAVVLKIVKDRVEENQIVACGEFAYFKALGNLSAVINGYARCRTATTKY